MKKILSVLFVFFIFTGIMPMQVYAKKDTLSPKDDNEKVDNFYEAATFGDLKKDLVSKYGMTSHESFVACLGGDIQKYPLNIYGIISMHVMDFDMDNKDELLVLRVEKTNTTAMEAMIVADLYQEPTEQTPHSKEILYISYCETVHIYTFYSDILNTFCMVTEGEESGSYTGGYYAYAGVYTISDRIEEYERWTNNTCVMEEFDDIKSELEKIHVPQNGSQITDTYFQTLCKIEHTIEHIEHSVSVGCFYECRKHILQIKETEEKLGRIEVETHYRPNGGNKWKIFATVTNPMEDIVMVSLNGDNVNIVSGMDAENLHMSIQYPSCMIPLNDENEVHKELLKKGESVTFESEVEVTCMPDGEVLGHYTVEKDQVLHLQGNAVCEKNHDVEYTISADGFEKTVEKLELPTENNLCDYIFESLTVKGALLIEDHCKVKVEEDFLLEDNNGILDWRNFSDLYIGEGAVLTVKGDFYFFPDDRIDTGVGKIEVYGDVDIRNFENAVLIIHAKESQSKFKIRHSTIDKLYINGEISDVAFDAFGSFLYNDKNTVVHNTYVNKNNIKTELASYNKMTMDILENTISVVDDSTQKVCPAELYEISPKDENIQLLRSAFNKWFVSGQTEEIKVKNYMDFFKLVQIQSGYEDGIRFDSIGVSNVKMVNAYYKNEIYTFTLSSDAMDYYASAVIEKLSVDTYEMMKKELKEAVEKDATNVGGKALGTFIKLFASAEFEALESDSDWSDFFKDIAGLTSREAKTLAKKCRCLQKYYDIIEPALDSINAAKKVNALGESDYSSFPFDQIVKTSKALHEIAD